MDEICKSNNVFLLNYKPKDIQQKDLKTFIQNTRYVICSLPVMFLAYTYLKS